MKERPEADEDATEASVLVHRQRMHGALKDRRLLVGSEVVAHGRANYTEMKARMIRTIPWPRWPTALSIWAFVKPRPIQTIIRQLFTQARPRLRKPLPKHNDLHSYLEYLNKSGKDPTTNVQKGTKYEYLVIDSLKAYGLELSRVGQAGDRGIDFEGIWKLYKHTKEHPHAVRVIGQCKASKAGPAEVRGLDGSDAGPRDCIRFLVSLHEASKGTTEAVQASGKPMAFVHINENGEVIQFRWNHAATAAGLGRIGTRLKYSRDTAIKETLEGDVVSKPTPIVELTCDGKPWRPRRQRVTKATVQKRSVTIPKAQKPTSQKNKPIPIETNESDN